MDERDALELTTATSTALLEALRDRGNQLVWHVFCQRYRRPVARYGRSAFGLTEDDAEDAAQQTLIEFHEAYLRGDYQRDRGRLRSWLFGIATYQMRQTVRKNFRRREVHAGHSGEDDVMNRLAASESVLEERWEEEWRQAIYGQCMVEVRRQFNTQTVEAFELFAKDGLTAREVAKRLGMTTNAVYLAKQHILKRIRELLPYMEEAY